MVAFWEEEMRVRSCSERIYKGISERDRKIDAVTKSTTSEHSDKVSETAMFRLLSGVEQQ